MGNVTIYKEPLRQELNTSKGGLWKWLHRKGEIAVFGAKAKVGVKTGRLKASIHMRHLGNFTGQYLWIGSERDHALIHHEGSRAHLIRPTPPNKVLAFTKGSRLIMTSQVRHPGTKPNPYLSSQLRHFVTK